MTESIKLFTVTCIALIAFAANSVFCRLALESLDIDPASFTSIRLISGAIALAIILTFQSKTPLTQITKAAFTPNITQWSGTVYLFSYAACFSFAYTMLDTATGALILFATVQLFLLLSQAIRGHRFNLKEILGIVLAILGFVLLTLPEATRPDWFGLGLMVIAGIAWAGYTLAGKVAQKVSQNTTENFIRCIPLSVVLSMVFIQHLAVSPSGILWATLSGVFASGIGYSLWYYSVKRITITQAAISQLLVPIIAGLGGVLLVDESLSTEFISSGLLILTGVALVSLAKPKPVESAQQ